MNAATSSVGRIDDMDIGSMKLARVGERRVVVIRTASGVYALDNACPHQGYGLVGGALDGELLTCQWHNWKFRVGDGACVVGEEDVECHQTEVVDGEILVTVVERSAQEARARLWPSLCQGFENNYVGQMARDTARLLNAGATAADIVWQGVAIASPREEYGIGHALAMAADCLSISDLYEGDDKTLPVLQALSGLAETTRNRAPRSLPPGDASVDLLAAIEAGDHDAALGSVVGRLRQGAMPAELRREILEFVGSHHLSYGHGAIYTQRTFELLERVGWDRAEDLLPWLVSALVYATREDSLPYMREAVRLISDADREAMVAAPDWRASGWEDSDGALRSTILEASQAPIAEAVEAVLAGAGVDGLLSAVSLAVSERLLRYDHAVEFDPAVDFGWLDITHGLTYARAARWAFAADPCPATARLALFAVFLAHDTGRAERRGLYAFDGPAISARPGDLAAAVQARRPDAAVAAALAGDRRQVSETLRRSALEDRAGSFIVTAHIVKLAQAAGEEAEATGSALPLAAAARYAAAPRLERFVAARAQDALDFVRTGSPPRR